MKGSEIKNLDFRVGFLGFKKSDVKACLAEISEYVIKLENEIRNLQIEKDKLKDQLHKIEITQANFKDIITSAQEFKKRIEKEAQEKAGEIIEKAKNQYKEILEGIKNEKSRLISMKRDVENLRDKFINNLDNFKNMIEFKEKNASLNENVSFNFENKDVKDEMFKVEKVANITINKSSNVEDHNKTLEFTKPIKNKPVKSGDSNDSLIKSKFQEIEIKR